MKNLFLLLSVFFCLKTFAQNTFSCYIKYAKDSTILPQATAKIMGTKKGAAADSTGKITIQNINTNYIQVTFSFVGLQNVLMQFNLPQTNEPPIIYLEDKPNTEEAVIISSSRTNSRIEDLPTKVEVLGSEEVNEEASTIPGNIASLLGDIAGIQTQHTSGTTGGVDLRVQGLPGKYTQLLRDGIPLFGGYSGSFSVLQIPPLDLKQIEIVKGASSTLYGGGAIAGMINVVSKTPKLNKPEHSILANYSSLKEFNLNTYHSNRNNNTGYTFFAGTTQQQAVDVNSDGFSDVPKLNSFFIHPKLFIYPNKKNTLTFEYDGRFEDRNGGDMQVLQNKKDNLHQFFIQNKSIRNSIISSWENKISNTTQLNFKGALSFFNRDITTNVFGMKAYQQSYFTELSYLKKWRQHTLVSGVNISNESFEKKSPDSSFINPYTQIILGAFVQHDWLVTKKLTIQSGLRFDYNDNYCPVLLPRLSALYKINSAFTTRLGGGFGYKAPSVFNSDVDERELRGHNLLWAELEKSFGASWDVTYKKKINDWHFTANQFFYITQINNPIIADINGGPFYSYINAKKPLRTTGTETYIALQGDEWEIYLGYTYTNAKQLFNTVQPNVALSARSKFAAVISKEFNDNFRACIEASYTGKQFLDDGTTKPTYFIAAGMLSYTIKKLTVVLNCENIFDYRQTKKENIVFGNLSNPSFKQIWAPIDGRVANFSVRYNF